jgi:hypothetical protein
MGGDLVGRATLIEEIVEAAGSGEAVEVVARCGFGKVRSSEGCRGGARGGALGDR